MKKYIIQELYSDAINMGSWQDASDDESQCQFETYEEALANLEAYEDFAKQYAARNFCEATQYRIKEC